MSQLRDRVNEILHPASDGDLPSRLVDLSLVALVFVDIVCLVLADSSSDAAYDLVPKSILIVFAVEYVLRLWACKSDPAYADAGGRSRYARSSFAIIDGIAVIPILAFTGLPIPVELTALRMFRLLKLFRYFNAGAVLFRTILRVREELAVISVALLMVILSSGLVLHRLEATANPEDFGSLGKSLWWAVVTMTTVGYGDAVPVTAWGRVIGSFVMVFGVGMFAIPAGLLGASFTREVTVQVERRRMRSQQRRRVQDLEREATLVEEAVGEALESRSNCPHCGESLATSEKH